MSKVAQAGAIVVRTMAGSARILLVTAKNNPKHWIFPKGHIEAGETARKAAVRELREEAGVEGELLERVGSTEFDFRDQRLRVEYFLLEFLAEVGPGEDRQCRWCSYEEALQLLSFDNTKGILIQARPLIERRVKDGSATQNRE